MAIVLDGTSGITTPEITSAGGPLVVNASAPDNSVVVDASGNVGIGTDSPTSLGSNVTTLDVVGTQGGGIRFERTNATTSEGYIGALSGSLRVASTTAIPVTFFTNNTERMRIDATGDLLIGTTTEDSPGLGNNTVGISAASSGKFFVSTSPTAAWFNVTSDGTIVSLRSGGAAEGSISVSGSTVSYNGGHLSRWAQTTTAKDESLVKGTVLSNLDEMNVYVDADGNPVENEQLNKVKVSGVEGDANVAGVFVNWDHDEDHNVDEINMAMTGDMIIRIAQGVTVQRGDLLMSAGDGTAKPQGDDIVRSKTIAKVTSTHVTCTYADGSFCVPCVLMAC
jgi:hypothetical protein